MKLRLSGLSTKLDSIVVNVAEKKKLRWLFWPLFVQNIIYIHHNFVDCVIYCREFGLFIRKFFLTRIYDLIFTEIEPATSRHSKSTMCIYNSIKHGTLCSKAHESIPGFFFVRGGRGDGGIEMEMMPALATRLPHQYIII